MMWKVIHKCFLKTNCCSALQRRMLKLEFPLDCKMSHVPTPLTGQADVTLGTG